MMTKRTISRTLASACWPLFALAGVAQAQDSAASGDRPRPIGNPGSWFTFADYPLPALEARQQGTVEFVLDIDAAGRPERCSLVRSSGAQALDAATCAVLMARARFEPVRPGAESHYRSRTTWSLPPVPIDSKGRPQLLVTFEFDRRPIRCYVVPKPERRLYLPSTLCKGMGSTMHRAGALIGDPVYVAIDTVEQLLRRRI